jgi:hypothetical protein
MLRTSYLCHCAIGLRLHYDSAADPKALSEYSLFQRPPHPRGQNRKDNVLPYQPR